MPLTGTVACDVLNRPAADIVIDPRDGLRQQVGASINVTHGVDARACGDGGGDRSRLMVSSGAGSHCQEVSSWNGFTVKRMDP